MKFLKLIIVVLLVCGVQSCKKNTSKSSNSYNNSNDYSNTETTYYSSDESEDEEPYPDDTYCSDVDYYNPNTGTTNSYTLNVEVEYNEVIEIKFSTGWLDDSEFSSEELDEDGYCEITLYDGREFEIQITGPECSFEDGYQIQNDMQQEVIAITCPNCGLEKNEYEELCFSCQDRIEKTCRRCGQYDSFMYSGDELCSDCKDKICSRCGQYDSFMFIGDELCSDCQGE
jgi:hypothetical protein